MRMMSIKKMWLIATFLATIMVVQTKGQEAVLTAGNSVSGSGGSISYTVGQISSASATANAGSVMEGVQQPFEIFEGEVGIQDKLGISLISEVYPNPVSGNLVLKVPGYNNEKLQFQLFDVNGRQISKNIISGTETLIPMGGLASDTYILRIIQKKEIVKTFRIIKH